MSIGPRQIIASCSGNSIPMDIMLRLPISFGYIFLFRISIFDLSTPSIFGWLGPYTSASIRPTLNPISAIDAAILLEIVDFPTPPFPEATNIIFPK